MLQNSIEIWGQAILDGRNTMGNVPDSVRTQVNDYVQNKVNSGYKPTNPVLTELQQKKAIGLQDQFFQAINTSKIQDVKGSYDSVKTIFAPDKIDTASGFDDIAAINAFQRMVDPGVSVREGDVSLIQSAIPWLDKVNPGYNWEKLNTGAKLPLEMRQALVRVAGELYNTKAESFDNSYGKNIKAIAEQANIPFDMIGQLYSDRAKDTPYERSKQCGSFVNDQLGLSGDKKIKDTYEEKLATVTSPEPIPGGFFIMNTGTPWGHAGIVDGADAENIYIRDRNFNGDGKERAVAIPRNSDFYKQITGYGK
jgi:hypothetical protein